MKTGLGVVSSMTVTVLLVFLCLSHTGFLVVASSSRNMDIQRAVDQYNEEDNVNKYLHDLKDLISVSDYADDEAYNNIYSGDTSRSHVNSPNNHYPPVAALLGSTSRRSPPGLGIKELLRKPLFSNNHYRADQDYDLSKRGRGGRRGSSSPNAKGQLRQMMGYFLRLRNRSKGTGNSVVAAGKRQPPAGFHAVRGK